MSSSVEDNARRFFDDFVEAFRSFNGEVITERYLAPYLAFHTYGAVQVFASTADIAAYFQRIVSKYYAQGCRSCRYRELAVVPLGKECALATVTWELLAQDLSVIRVWRESYNLCLVDGHFMVFTSTDHAD